LGSVGAVLIGITVLLTLFSGICYLAKNWDLLREG
jgi:hypothetical protein